MFKAIITISLWVWVGMVTPYRALWAGADDLKDYQTVNTLIKEGETHLNNLDLAAALTKFESIFKGGYQMTVTQKALVWFLIGNVHILLGDETKGSEAMKKCLTVKSAFVPPQNTSEIVVTIFNKIKSSFTPPTNTSDQKEDVDLAASKVLILKEPVNPKANAPINFTVFFKDNKKRGSYKELTFYYRQAGTSKFSKIRIDLIEVPETKFPKGFMITPPSKTVYEWFEGAVTENLRLQYYVDLVSKKGKILDSIGNMTTLKTVLISKVMREVSVKTPWYKSWWFWTIVGGVLVTSVTLAVYYTLPSPTLVRFVIKTE